MTARNAYNQAESSWNFKSSLPNLKKIFIRTENTTAFKLSSYYKRATLTEHFSVQHQFSLVHVVLVIVKKNCFGATQTDLAKTGVPRTRKVFPAKLTFANLVHGCNRTILFGCSIIIYNQFFVSVIPTHPYLELANDNCQNIREFCENHVGSLPTVN